jgi:membrane dipeptidase
MINRGRCRLFADDRTEHSARAVDLVHRSLALDMLGLLTLDWPKLYRWHKEPQRFGEADLSKLQGSGVRVFHPAVEPHQTDPHESILRWMNGWNRFLAGHPGELLRIDAASDLKRVHDEGKIGILIGFQNSDHFRTVDDVALFHGLGQRVSQLTYNVSNRIGSGCKDPQNRGLTEYGVRIVAAMNRVGMAVDISHCSERTALDAIAAAKKPVLITHSNCQALVPHPRCKSNAVIRAMAARGGVMGITIIPAFVGRRLPVTLSNVLDHFDHVARLAGVEHVGIGSDCDIDAIDPRTNRVRPRYEVRGLRLARRTFAIAEGLLRRGYGEREVEMVLGGNFQRALKEIWDVPRSAPAAAPQRQV